MRYYYADPTNNPVGPYPLEDLHQLHIEGVIHADTLVAEEGGEAWFPYRSLVVPPPAPPPMPAMPAMPATPPSATPPPVGYSPSPAYAVPPGAHAPNTVAAPPVGPHAVPQNDANTAMFLHLSTFLGYLLLGVGLVIPILLWALNKDRSWFINRHGVAFLNALFSYLIYAVVCGILTFVLIGYPMLAALIIMDFVATILAALAASRGELYEYPLTIKFMR
jgi:uncharacterized Tic20 family protein